MIFVSLPDKASGERHVIVVFGAGLIGGAIAGALCRLEDAVAEVLPLSWSSAALRRSELAGLMELLTDRRTPTARIDLVWAAGCAGFGASSMELALETEALDDILAWGRILQASATRSRLTIHMLSSAGGLFEGQRLVDAASVPRPLRPYGEAKLAQEKSLEALRPQMTAHVYRPSSVYGFGVRGARAGLLNTLVDNSKLGRTTRIFGGLDTLRDYVLSTDVGTFIARKITMPEETSQTFLLATGKPTSIFEMIRLVREVIGQPLKIKLDVQPSRAGHISFRPGGLPSDWRPADLETGIRIVTRSLSQRFVTKTL